MAKLLGFIRAVPFNQIFLLAIAVLLFLQWREQCSIVKNLEEANRDIYRILWQIDQDIPGK